MNKLSWSLLTIGIYLQVHLAYLYTNNIILPEAIRYHLQTCYVLVTDIAMHIHCTYQLSWSLVLTLFNLFIN